MSGKKMPPMADERWGIWGGVREVRIGGDVYRVQARYHAPETGLEAGPLKWWQRVLYHLGDKLHTLANRGCE